MKRFALALVLLAGCTTSPPPARDFQGSVVDPEGMPILGVTVHVYARNGILTTMTGVRGEYSVHVPPGKYLVIAELPGFGRSVQRVVFPQKRPLQMEFHVATMYGAVTEAITVAAGPRMSNRSLAALKARPEQLRSAYYAPITENDSIDARKRPVTTFSIDVDGASYSNVRHFLVSNVMPPPDAVRLEEMVNYFTYHYPQPSDGRPVAISTEVAGCPWAPEHRLLRVALQAKTVDQWKVAPNNLVFLLDVSGSMSPPDRLPLIREAMRLLVDQLGAADTISIVVYAGAAGLVLPPTPASRNDLIEGALDGLETGGSTAGGEGIELAYKIALDHFLPNGNTRVILATDGDFNVGLTSIDALTRLIEEKRTQGIYLTCIGVGTDNLQDGLIEGLADKGNGNYYYLDSMAEAEKVFVKQLTGTLVAVADDVKVQIEFDPALVASYRQIGYEDRALENKDFTDDTKDAGELGSGQSVTALYEIVPAAAASGGRIATVRVRYKEPRARGSKEIAAAAIDERKSAYDASPDTQFAAAVAEFGMLLRDSRHKGHATYDDVAALARAMRGEDMEGYRQELIQLVEASRAIIEEQHVATR